MTSQVPILHQPIYIQPEEKKDRPAPGEGLYNDVYNSYRLGELSYLIWVSPLACAAGALVGLAAGTRTYYLSGAPKKIAEDAEVKDFGATVHAKGITSVYSILMKRFGLGVLPQVHCELLTGYLFNVEEITALSYCVKHGSIALKTARLANEIVMRAANWADIPVK